MVRSVAVTESEWDQQQQAWMTALAEYRAGSCPCGCGYSLADTTTTEGAGPVFTADRVVCRARLALLEAQKAAATTDVIGGARLWSVEMRKE